MGKNFISWPKACRERARADGKALVAFGFDNSTIQGCTGGMAVVTSCDTRTAQIVTTFATYLVYGKMPVEQAYRELVRDIEAFDARESEKAAKQSPEVAP